MTSKISKGNADLGFFNSRIDEIAMSSHARLRAKAQLARAEAIADVVAKGLDAIARLFKSGPARPNRPATSAS